MSRKLSQRLVLELCRCACAADGCLAASRLPAAAFSLARTRQMHLGRFWHSHDGFAEAQQSSLAGLQRRLMFIQTQSTPNPSSLMFLPGKPVMESGTKDFSSAREAMASPLATALFRIDGVEGVFYGSDFVTIKKADSVEWSLVKAEVYAAIMDHFASGKPLFTDADGASPSDTAISDEDSDVVAMIKELLETRIKPAVAEDGGDILFKRFEEDTGRVVLKMQGACEGCPSSASTLKGGIESMMRHYIPEVKEVVEAEPDEHEAEGLKAFSRLEQHLSH